MATDFAILLQRYLTSHLAGLRGASPNTIASYRDTFKLLIIYMRDQKAIPPEKLVLDCIDVEAITGFLNWLESGRHNSISTRNQRLAAISSFYTWMQSQEPALMARCQEIIAIPIKRGTQVCVHHLSVEQTRCLLAAPDRNTRTGRRDATLLATLYDTGARVQELVDLTVGDVRLQKPAVITLTGKGRKTRHVPIGANTVALLANYLAEFGLDKPGRDSYPVFFNQQHAKLSRGGVAWILDNSHLPALLIRWRNQPAIGQHRFARHGGCARLTPDHPRPSCRYQPKGTRALCGRLRCLLP